MKVIVVASHSGGHISPAIAFCQNLKKRDTHVDIVFVTTDGEVEKSILGDQFKTLFFKKERIALLNSYKLLGLYFRCAKIINKEKPDLVVGFGGYLSVPFIIDASFKRINNFIHEQNREVGLANKFLANFAKIIITTFPDTKICKRLQHKIKPLGIPVREEVRRISKEEARSFFGFDSDLFVVLVLGGSQGARKINNAMLELSKSWDLFKLGVIHITGPNDYERIFRRYETGKIKYKVFSLFNRMEYAYSAVDLAVCRAGASTMAEIAKLRLPAIFVPYPYAKQHQTSNARFLSDKGAAILVDDDCCAGQTLKEKIVELKNNAEALKAISQKLEVVEIEDRNNRIVELAIGLFHG